MGWLHNFNRERRVRHVLRALARQRVAVAVGGFLAIELAPHGLPDQDEAIQTCLMRGWIAVLHDAVPATTLPNLNGPLPDPKAGNPKPIYRITEAGWAVINRTHEWVVATFAVSAVAMVAALLALAT